MRRYVIERDIPGIGRADGAALRDASEQSNEALAALAPDVQWVESFVTADRTFCVYLAQDEAAIRRHADLSGFPASRIHPVESVFDPTTASAPVAARS